MKTYRKETFLISICTLFLFVFVFFSIGNATQTDVPETTGSVETTSTGETSDGQTTTTLSITGGTTSVFTPASMDFGELETSSSEQEKNIELEAPNYFGIEDLKGQGGYYTTLQIGELSDGDKTLEVTEAKVKIPDGEIHTIAGQEDSNISVPAGVSDFILFDSENPANILERVVTTNGKIGKYGVLPHMKLTIAAYQQVGDYEGTITFTIIEDGSISSLAYASCNELLDNYPSLTSGVYTINPNGSEEFEVYCDMETDGGGWTIFARTYGKNSSWKYGFDNLDNNYDYDKHTFKNIEGFTFTDMLMKRHDSGEFYTIKGGTYTWPTWGTHNPGDGYTIGNHPTDSGFYIRAYDSDIGKNYQLCFHDAHNDECGPSDVDGNNYGDAGGNDDQNMLWNGNEFDPTGISIDFGVR